MATAAAAPGYRDLDGVLLRNVRNGFVDYDGIRADPAFGRFVAAVGTTDPSELEDAPSRLAFLLNAYNALAIQAVLDGGSTDSRSARRHFFERDEHQVLGAATTLGRLAGTEIPAAGDPRARFALACAALACPRLASRAYLPSELDRQLEAAARAFVNDGSRNRFDPARRVAFLSRVFEQYAPEFVARSGSVQRYLADYAADPEVASLLRQDGFEVRYLPDDWELNGIYRGRPE